MILITKQSGKYYGFELPRYPQDIYDTIAAYVREAIPVIIVESLEDLEALVIYDIILMVNKEN